MPSDLSNYLASQYLVADPKSKSKKSKRKQKETEKGLLITDDDAQTWGGSHAQLDDEGEDAPVTVSGTSAEFKRAKKSNWKSLGGGSTASISTEARHNDDAEADAIIASAALEEAAARANEDELPAVEATDVIKMSDGTHAGLQSAAAVSAQLRRRQQDEREEFERHRKSAQEEETVYRDATGRRIDISMKRAEARRAAADALEKERQKVEALKGEVQLSEARQRRQQLDDAKTMAFARRADDEELNREMKDRARWNDPMAQFMDDTSRASKSSRGGKKRPVYTGAAPPNRYGIKPGYRWDGVDRGNGFEAERFKALNRRERNKGLDYSWQMDE